MRVINSKVRVEWLAEKILVSRDYPLTPLKPLGTSFLVQVLYPLSTALLNLLKEKPDWMPV